MIEIKIMQAFFLLCSLLMLSDAQAEAGRAIRFNMAPEGFPPYMIVEDGKSPSGILYDVLSSIGKKHGFKVAPRYVPRKRVEAFILNEDLDAGPLAKEWSKDPESFIFTDPIIVHRDVLFYLASHPLTFNKIEDLFGKKIRVRFGYRYPMLDGYFAAEKITAFADQNEAEMLEKLLMAPGRFDAALVNEIVGLWLIKKNGWKDKFLYSDKMAGSADYRIMFNRKWAPFVKKFNRSLSEMKNNGELEDILAQYKN